MQVATLVDEFKSAGSYEIDFDAINLASGIVFYTITGGFICRNEKDDPPSLIYTKIETADRF